MQIMSESTYVKKLTSLGMYSWKNSRKYVAFETWDLYNFGKFR